MFASTLCSVFFLVMSELGYSQAILPAAGHGVSSRSPQLASICGKNPAVPAVQEALRLACLLEPDPLTKSSGQGAIVIGFVGGFVRQDDVKHPEVLFAAYLRERYPAAHVEVFANHDGEHALHRVTDLLHVGHGDLLTADEKEKARIIIYGHSWGGSQAIALARALGRRGIPVLLTIQLDSIHKPGQNDSRIPANVITAVNFYQPRGLLHGRKRIRADDAKRTKILGNFRMTYEGNQINCSNYPWLVRTLNKPHHQIENDPRVWDQVASLIHSELSISR